MAFWLFGSNGEVREGGEGEEMILYAWLFFFFFLFYDVA